MYYRAKDIARALNVSASTIRRYESLGLVPAPERGTNGYRKYTEIHFAYFRFIRAMHPSVDMNLIAKVVASIRNGDPDLALWYVSQAQATLYEEKVFVEQALDLLTSPEISTGMESFTSEDEMTIGHIAKSVNVAQSAIRHWEKKGLIVPVRCPQNGYRLYTRTHLRQILLIRSLRNARYSLRFTKSIVKAVEHDDITLASTVIIEAMEKLNRRNRSMVHGIHELYRLCDLTGLWNE